MSNQSERLARKKQRAGRARSASLRDASGHIPLALPHSWRKMDADARTVWLAGQKERKQP